MDDIPVPFPARPARFMDRLRAFMRGRQLAYRMKKSYCGWMRGFIRFQKKRRPDEIGKAQVDA
ncbi:phage integrase N-terminal SAM-like domain-containing protein [Microbulbifer donghaiensis]|uniref:phage integrase N-terminal SAM-like domain-containing protein n=1 Tax=Microbulbifer donghaiensis TaxID=494016 RepID=UPI000933789B|nr:phage integrase N-terminal SAM-like domain-containing protein [Microbulbifer donghaiensis]